MLVPMLLIFGVMYLLVIRPQSRKAKEKREMLSKLKNGDQVVTSGGVIGRISRIMDDEVSLLVSDGVRFRFQRSAITERLKQNDVDSSSRETTSSQRSQGPNSAAATTAPLSQMTQDSGNKDATVKQTNTTNRCKDCEQVLGDFHYEFESCSMSKYIGMHCPGCGQFFCMRHIPEEMMKSKRCAICGARLYSVNRGAAKVDLDMVEMARREGKYGAHARPPQNRA